MPLAPGYLVRDLAATSACRWSSPPRPGLGTINHTLLTIEAARAAGLEVASVVLTPWPDAPSQVEESNRETIAALGRVRVDAARRSTSPTPIGWPALRTTASGAAPARGLARGSSPAP